MTWARPVLGIEALSVGTNVPFEDGDHVVVQLTTGKRVILDVADGSTAPVSSTDIFWCEQNPEYHVKTAAGASVNGERESAPVFQPCSDKGTRVRGRPSRAPESVGVSAAGLFIWPTPRGLQAERAPG